jgi:hypothetical protein
MGKTLSEYHKVDAEPVFYRSTSAAPSIAIFYAATDAGIIKVSNSTSAGCKKGGYIL